MTNRDVLAELINEVAEADTIKMGGEWVEVINIDEIADHLIANGVVVNTWRDAKIEPPPIGEDVLLRFANETMVVGGLREDGGWYVIVDAEWYSDCETVPEKWQPLPEVMKEETK